MVGADAQGHARQGVGAREDVTALAGVVLGAGDLRVVGGDEGLRDQEEGGAGVGDGVDGRRNEGGGTDRVAVAGKLPEAHGGVNGDIGDTAGVLGGIDEAEIVAARRALHQVGGEKRSGQVGQGVEEEGLLRRRRDGVDRVEGQAQQAVAVGVLFEFGADRLGQLDPLPRHLGGADVDGVAVDVAAGATAVAVGDVPRFAGEELGGAGVGRVVEDVAGVLGAGKLGGEDPSGWCQFRKLAQVRGR